MGRTYRGIQVPTLRQYVLLSEAANETDGKRVAGLGVDNNGKSITTDDRWVFIEDNPDRELKIWPFFWQQGEYVLGGGETNYMFLALAADKFYGAKE